MGGLWKPYKHFKNIFFTGDNHFNHFHIIEACKRPYKSVQEMNEDMILKWNAKVGPDDCTFVVGDMFMNEKPQIMADIVSRLNGRIFLIPGSHDRHINKLETLTRGKVKPIEQIVVINMNPEVVVICHYALRVWPCSHYGSWMLHGHTHGRLLPQGKSWDVGVDVNGFAPLSWYEIKVIMSKRPKNIDRICGEEGGGIFWPFSVHEYEDALRELPSPEEMATDKGLGVYAAWWEVQHKRLLGRMKTSKGGNKPFFTKD